MTPPESPNRGVVRRAAPWTLALSGLAGAISLVLSGHELALGIALGALIGFANLALLAGAIGKLVANPEQHRPARPGGMALPAILLVKWPLLLLALTGVLWYLPARPEGLAIGVALSLAAATLAARRR